MYDMTKTNRYVVGTADNGRLIIVDVEGLDDYYHLGNDMRDVKMVCKMLNDKDDEIRILQQQVQILREEIESTRHILKMQARKLEGY